MFRAVGTNQKHRPSHPFDWEIDMAIRCSNQICKLHLDNDTCALNSIRVQVVEVEDYYTVICADEMPRKYRPIRYGLEGEYEIEQDNGSVKIVKNLELFKELPK